MLSLLAKELDFDLGNKQTQRSFSQSESNASDIFELIHCDILEAYRIPFTCGAHYFLSIVDDASGCVWVYLMHDKSEASILLQIFVVFVKKSVWERCEDYA